jgi:hypothetical protein
MELGLEADAPFGYLPRSLRGRRRPPVSAEANAQRTVWLDLMETEDRQVAEALEAARAAKAKWQGSG